MIRHLTASVLIALVVTLCGAALAQPDESPATTDEATTADSAQPGDAVVAAAADEATEAPAATVPDAAADPIGTVTAMIKAIKAGQWRWAAVCALALLMLVLSKFDIRDKIAWFRGDRGGAILVMALALMGALLTALAAPVELDWKLFAGAVGVAWTAVGGVQWVKRLIWPKDKAEPESVGDGPQ